MLRAKPVPPDKQAAVPSKTMPTSHAGPSGNAPGPFTTGQTVRIRTRVTNGNGTTTVIVRTLTLVNP